MVVGEIAERVDLLVIGGGPGGYTAALRAAELGRTVTLVERGGAEALGGSCLHVGCIPSKMLIEVAHTAHRVREMAAMGLTVDGVAVDLARFQTWAKQVIGGLASGVASLLADRRVEVVAGTARFSRADRVAVETPSGPMRYFEFRDAIIATGSRPGVLPDLEPDGDRILDSTGALALDVLPRTATIVGAGYIGMEIGVALSKLGVGVTVVEALDRILPTVDEALARPVLRRAEELGMTIHLSARVVGVEADDLIVEKDGGRIACPAAKVVVAVGRVPNTHDLGLENAGVTVNGGLIAVDEQRRCTPAIAAIGDVVEGPALAHKASAEARVAAEALCGMATTFEPAAIPAVVFTDPEVASVGLSEAEARAAGYDVTVAGFPLSASGRAATMGATGGFVRVVADRGADRLVGVHVVGPHASELIAEGTLAIEMMASPHDVAGTIHPHPTLSEAVADATERLLSLDGAPRAARVAQGV
jgi:dihydrolipoamide dehydrogenase